MAADTAGNVLLAHASLGAVFVLDAQRAVIAWLVLCRGARVTNLAFGGPDRRTVLITVSATGTILAAERSAAGLPLAA